MTLIDTARLESSATVVDGGTVALTDGTATLTADYIQLDQGVTYPENIVIQDCGCQSGMIAPVVYQEPIMDAASEVAGTVIAEGAVEPVADATSVVESPIIESAPVYSDAGVVTEGAPMVTEGAPMVVEGDPIGISTPSCGCGGGAAPAAMPTEGLISSSAPVVSYQSTPMTYSQPAPAAAPACCTPARRGFFRTLFGR